MRKLNIVAASVAMAVSGVAQATLPVDVEIFVSGATAPSNMLREHTVQNSCDQTQPINVYVDQAVDLPGGGNNAVANPIMSQGQAWVVECTADAGMGANLAGKKMAVYKYEHGSSGGTTPVASQIAINFMDADASCSLVAGGPWTHGNGGTFNLYECPTAPIVAQTPDGGVSDIEPTQFVGELAGSSGDFADLGNLNTVSGPGLIFGIGVTKAMRDELQADQGLTVGAEDEANMPTLPSTFIRSVFSGKIKTWSEQSVLGNTLNVPAGFSNTASICRRFQGSGTHAEYMVHYQRANCQAGSLSMVPQGTANPFLGTINAFGMSGSSDLGKCLNAVDTGAGYTNGSKTSPAVPAGFQSFAMGYQSTEKNTNLARNYRFVKIDGVAPTLENAFNGTYRQVYYLSFQNRNDGSFVSGGIRAANATPAQVSMINDFFANGLDITGPIVKSVNDSLVILDSNNGNVNVGWQGGFLQPSASAPVAFSAANPLTPWARETTSGEPDSCQPLYQK